MQQAKRSGWGIGDEVVEDVRAIWECASDEVEDGKGERIDGLVIAFGGFLELGGCEEGGGRPDVGAHEEAAGESQGGG